MLQPILLTLSLGALGLAYPYEKRMPGQVITQCMVPNTAALTFVRLPHMIVHAF